MVYWMPMSKTCDAKKSCVNIAMFYVVLSNPNAKFK